MYLTGAFLCRANTHLQKFVKTCNSPKLSGASSCMFFLNRINLIKSLLNKIKFYYLHYRLFTPRLRFIYSVKRLFAYCFDKAPTIYLQLYMNGFSKTTCILSKYFDYITQGLKDVILALFCCVYKLKGGVV